MNQTSTERGPTNKDLLLAVLEAKDTALARDAETGEHLSGHSFQAGPGGRQFLGRKNVLDFGGGQSVGDLIHSKFDTKKSDNGIRTSYDAIAVLPKGRRPSKRSVSIVRFDNNGNEVYRHESRDPRMARQVGITAAKSVVRSIERDRAAERQVA